MTRIDLITLQQIRDASPCREGWTKLLNSLGGIDTPLTTVVSIGDVAKSNDAQDALWCCRLIDNRRFIVSLIMPSVKRASKHTDDKQVYDCIAALDKWLTGDDTVNLKAYATTAAHAVTAYTAAADAVYATATAYTADAVIRAAERVAYTAATRAIERSQQIKDIIAISPLYALTGDK